MHYISKILIVIGLLVCAASVSAQDIITQTDGTKIEAKVEKITETTVEYRKASNPTGPIYTVSLTSVASIKYENGSVDTFNPSTVTAATSSATTTSGSVSDDYLRRLASSLDDNTAATTLPAGNTNDVDLLKLNRNYSNTSYGLYERAKKYRKRGWIIGGTIAGLGIVASIIAGAPDEYGENGYGEYFAIIGGPAIAVGAAVCIGCHAKARSLSNKARAMEMYSASIMEGEIMNFGKTSLSAGVNVMGNQLTHTRGVGFALSYNF